jgi:hypothetical protein
VKLDEILKKNIGKPMEISCKAVDSPNVTSFTGKLKEVNEDYICLETPIGLSYINRLATTILDFTFLKGAE